MISIFIKSFNRPYYLDRCLESIFQHISGQFVVKILDDGTPQKYLQKIKEKFPTIEIVKSKHYPEKIKAIEENLKNGTEINGFQIPTDLWISEAKKASEYFIMTEDDVWFTQKININEIEKECKSYTISLLKLAWLGNFQDDNYVNISKLSHHINSCKPKNLLIFPCFLNDWFFYNKYKFFSILFKLGRVDNNTMQQYWSLNSILMGFWQKDYWLYVWKDARGKVDEKQQLRNASAYFKKNISNENFIGRLSNEAMNTTFQSSATNSYHKYGFDFDVNRFNYLINEAWFNGNFDAMQNYPKDFSFPYFCKFVEHEIKVSEFEKWVNQFKTQYRNLGCKVD